jgi:hypothetical protein
VAVLSAVAHEQCRAVLKRLGPALVW